MPASLARWTRYAAGLCAMAWALGPETADAQPPRLVFPMDVAAGDPWLPGRLVDLTRHRLFWLGYPTRRIPSGGALSWVPPEHIGTPIRISVGKVRSAMAAEGDVPVDVWVGSTRLSRVHGRPKELDGLAFQLVQTIQKHFGCALGPGTKDGFGGLRLPWALQRLAGQAGLRRSLGQLRQAKVSLGRVIGGLRGQPAVRELRAVAELRRQIQGPDASLVAAALDRAEEGLRKHDVQAVMTAALDALRFGITPQLRWRFDLPRTGAGVWMSSQAVWVSHQTHAVRIDPMSGQAGRPLRVRGTVAGVRKSDVLIRRGMHLLRMPPHGAPRWRVRLPAGLDLPVMGTGAGQILLEGPQGVAWIEATRGELLLRSSPAKRLASGEMGALVQSSSISVGLLRPGRDALAWQEVLPQPIQGGYMTASRGLVIAGNRLHMLDLHDGVGRKPPLPVGPKARMLGADGRHAVVAIRGNEVAIIDVLAGAVNARVRGPGRPVAALSLPYEISVLWEEGDLLRWDPDGVLLDRARVRGRPQGIHQGPPEAPGPVVETADALYAFSAIEPRQRSDVDVLLMAAGAAEQLGMWDSAFALATEVAASEAGRIVEAEELRLRLLRSHPSAGWTEAAQRWAESRWRAAQKVSTTVPPFAMYGCTYR